ncbi:MULTISPECIES: hypothetical protein [unclassified Nocardioides]|uniref:hypothetical protein n=1 Tax=unclassified Nocardioides TaxID=2615069 RepID=UPI003620BF6B
MPPAAQNNYAIDEHGILFWTTYLGSAITLTIAMLGLFLFMVHRNSRATRAAQDVETPASSVAALPEPAEPSTPGAPHAA